METLEGHVRIVGSEERPNVRPEREPGLRVLWLKKPRAVESED